MGDTSLTYRITARFSISAWASPSTLQWCLFLVHGCLPPEGLGRSHTKHPAPSPAWLSVNAILARVAPSAKPKASRHSTSVGIVRVLNRPACLFADLLYLLWGPVHFPPYQAECPEVNFLNFVSRPAVRPHWRQLMQMRSNAPMEGTWHLQASEMSSSTDRKMYYLSC